jgi:hypothetical protein
MIDVYSLSAKGLDLGKGMGNKKNSDSPLLKFFHFGKTFGLKFGVADGKDFVDDENLGVDMDSNGESQTHVHAGGIMFDRLIDKF